MRNEYDQRAILAYAKKEGKEEVARNMLCDGVEPTLVARYTKLPKEQILALSKG